MLKLINVNKHYQVNKDTVIALNNVNIELPNTGLYSIIGKSGAGKTTLLNCIAGIDKVTSGNIYFNDVDITKIKGKQLDNYREEVAFIFQDYNLLSEYTVEENIALSIKIQGVSNIDAHSIVMDALNEVGLSGYENRKITQLSGGEQQRVVIARALAKKSKVIFCDEPTGNLDESTSRSLFDILKKLSKDILVVVVTHNNTLANDYSDGIVEIDSGNIVANNILLTKNEVIFNQQIVKKGLNLSFYFKLCFDQIKTLKFFSIFILLLFICSFSVFTIFNSVSNFDSTEALLNTLKYNNQTMLGIRKYNDYVKEETTDKGTEYDYGISVKHLEDTEEETEKLKEKLNNKAVVYNSYTYIKSFNSLFGLAYPFELNSGGDDFVFHYHAFNFNQIIAVDDFNNFAVPLLYGKLPQNKNEILIYDYMADNMIYHHCFDCSIENIVGKKIKDETQRLELTIVGIVKSNYKDYEYTDGMSNNCSSYGLMYLNSLKSIFASKELVNRLELNYSIDLVTLVNTNEDDSIIEKTLNGYNTIKNIEEDIDYIVQPEEECWTIAFTVSQVSDILGLNRRPTDKELHDFVDNYHIRYNVYTDESYDAFYSRSPRLHVAVVEDSAFNDNQSLHAYLLDNQCDGYISEYTYLGLDKDYTNAYEVLSMLKMPVHDDQYYEECIKNKNFYEITDFCIYDTSQVLIDKASEYIYEISDIAKTYSIFCYILIVIGIIAFCLLSIKKQTYKIGILKSLGAKNLQIGLSFVISITIIAMIAYLISIPCSYIYMGSINSGFVNEVENINLIMFSINKEGLLIPLLITLGITLFTSLVTYITFTVNPPVLLIRQNKER